MNKKTTYRTILLTFAMIALIAAAVLLLIDRTASKTFSDIVPHTNRFEACQILCITVERDDAVTISGSDLTALLNRLDRYEYHHGGTYGSTLEGTLYHVYFSSQGAEPFHMIVSDLGKIYIGSDYYALSPEIPADGISSYIDTLFA